MSSKRRAQGAVGWEGHIMPGLVDPGKRVRGSKQGSDGGVISVF